MQPAAHGRHRILAIATLSAAVILTATLLFTLQAAAATRLPSPQDSILNAANSSPCNPNLLAGTSNAIALSGDQHSTSDRHDNKNKVIGYVLGRPTEGFFGTWYSIQVKS
jgi:hypothetical protein